MNYAMCFEEIAELGIKVISSVVCVDNLDGGVELCLGHFVKDFEEVGCFRFLFHHVYPTESSVIVNKEKKPSHSSDIENF